MPHTQRLHNDILRLLLDMVTANTDPIRYFGTSPTGPTGKPNVMTDNVRHLRARLVLHIISFPKHSVRERMNAIMDDMAYIPLPRLWSPRLEAQDAYCFPSAVWQTSPAR
jgi:hypothetical protein